MQLSLRLSQIDHATLPNFIQPKESTAYITISGCVLDHIVVNRVLSSIEKIYFLLVHSLSLINSKGSNQRSVALSAESWAKRLNCSKSRVFSLQRTLSDKGYFIITKDKNKHNQNRRNLICPTLPDSVFKDLCKTPDRAGQEHLYFVPNSESKLQYLDRTKLFIMLKYQVLKDIWSCEYIPHFHKLVWIDFYARCYKSHMINFGSPANIDVSITNFSFTTSYKQLEDRFTCDKRILSAALVDLEEFGLIKRVHFYVKKENDGQDRQDKSLWKIFLLSPKQLNSNSVTRQSHENSDSSAFVKPPYSISFNSNSKLLPISVNASSSFYNNTKTIETHFAVGIGQDFKLQTDSRHEQYVQEVIEELEEQDKLEESVVVNNADMGEGKGIREDRKVNRDEGNTYIDEGYTNSTLDLENRPVLETNENKGSRVIRNTDPEFLSSTLYLTKDILLKSINSNLGDMAKNKTTKFPELYEKGASNRRESIPDPLTDIQCLERIKELNQISVGGECGENKAHRGVSRRVKKSEENVHKASEFNISASLIRDKLILLSKDKADKARKFAYSLVSKKLAKGYAASLSKHELAKQLIHHAATWKPTKLGSISRGKEIDTALAVAWKAVVAGTWQIPLELAKAEALQHEFNAYKHKYQQSGVISKELISLQSIVKTLLGCSYINLEREIKKCSPLNADFNNEAQEDSLNNNNLALMKMQNTYSNDSNSYISNDNSYDNDLPQLHKNHSNNVELPSYLEEKESYLSYGYCDDKDKGLDTTDDYDGLNSESEYSDTNITCKDEGKGNNSTDQITNRVFDLSNISEKQKYLRMATAENGNEMIIKTLNEKEYFYKLKSMEFNDEGDTVMTLKHVKLGLFLEEASNEIFAETVGNEETCSLDDKSNHLTLNSFNMQNQRFL